MSLVGKVWRRTQEYFPAQGFYFDRPIIVFQSDDWGRVGLRDQEGFEQLKSAGLMLGERPYDLYTLEVADDLAALGGLLSRHRDSAGRAASIVFNFILANLDYPKMKAGGYREIHLFSLADGLPEGWNRPGLLEGYREGIAAGVFHPALHGSTHFCRPAVERNMADAGERGSLLRTLWDAGTPYIHWRMPWIGYEYWDPEQSEDERFLSRETQQKLIGQTMGAFAKLFSTLPRSACAPGYRANSGTHKAWAQHGIHTAQGGPGRLIPPYFDRNRLLQLSRNLDFEPAVDSTFSLELCLRQAEDCFARGIPAIVSMHSINFHSSVRDARSITLARLEEFLTALEKAHPDLLYLHDEDLFQLVDKGSYASARENVRVNVTKKTLIKAQAVAQRRA